MTYEPDTDINKALNARIVALPNESNLSKTLQLENSKFDPETTDLDYFYRTNVILAIPEMIGAFVNGDYRTQGELRVIVSIRKGTGTIIGSQKADNVKNWFPRGLLLTSGPITVNIQRSYRRSGMPQGNFYHLPISIEFWAYQSYQPS